MNELVYLKKEEAVCDSLTVAEKFGKRHDVVLRSIENILNDANSETAKMWFQKTQYKSDNNNKSYPMYLMNRDGFSLLVMGFNGKKALEWKVKYIKAFNSMETILKEKATNTWLETRTQGKLTRKAETDIIQKLVEYAKEQGSGNADKLYMTYSKLANRMAGITKREQATVTQLNNLSLMENIILNCIQNGIAQGKQYKEIYKDCKRRLEAFKDIAYLESVTA